MQVSRLAEFILSFWKLFHEFSPSLVKSAFRLVFFCFSRNMSARVLDDDETVYAYGYRCAGATMCSSTGWVDVDFVFPLGLILNDLSDFMRIAGAQPSVLSFSIFLLRRRPLVVVIVRRLPLRISPLMRIG